jgi:hypothetical protein
MQKIPVGIRDIRLSTHSDLEMVARFEYRRPALPRKSIDENITFGMTYDFAAIIGKEFNEHEISEWVKAHNGNWDKALFFIEMIKMSGAAI